MILFLLSQREWLSLRQDQCELTLNANVLRCGQDYLIERKIQLFFSLSFSMAKKLCEKERNVCIHNRWFRHSNKRTMWMWIWVLLSFFSYHIEFRRKLCTKTIRILCLKAITRMWLLCAHWRRSLICRLRVTFMPTTNMLTWDEGNILIDWSEYMNANRYWFLYFQTRYTVWGWSHATMYFPISFLYAHEHSSNLANVSIDFARVSIVSECCSVY